MIDYNSQGVIGATSQDSNLGRPKHNGMKSWRIARKVIGGDSYHSFCLLRSLKVLL